ncbi:MAG TPA: iron-sulfur cluster assembly accessory protein [Gammaproteobacteria bacterium]|nr:iron-sulfur cluster assembly accessory protein [Gammaproteobacteria bacterium]
MEQITRDMTIEEIFKRFPSKSQKLAQEVTNTGLHCVGCSAATCETLEAGMYGHGMTDSDIDGLVGRLNQILAEKEDLTTITITERAAKKYLEILTEEGKTGWGIRFGERAAGCSGFEYFLDYSEKAKPGDLLLESQGIQIHLHHKSVDRLMGSVIDYIDGLNGAGFKITNPNVKASCGCGNSHGY